MTKAHPLRGTVAASLAAYDYNALLKQRANSKFSDTVVGMLQINSTLQRRSRAKCISSTVKQVSTMLLLPLLNSFNLMDAVSLTA